MARASSSPFLHITVRQTFFYAVLPFYFMISQLPILGMVATLPFLIVIDIVSGARYVVYTLAVFYLVNYQAFFEVIGVGAPTLGMQLALILLGLAAILGASFFLGMVKLVERHPVIGSTKSRAVMRSLQLIRGRWI